MRIQVHELLKQDLAEAHALPDRKARSDRVRMVYGNRTASYDKFNLSPVSPLIGLAGMLFCIKTVAVACKFREARNFQVL